MQIQGSQARASDDRMGLSVGALKRSIINHLFFLRGKLVKTATPNDYAIALAHTVRDRLLHPWVATTEAHATQQVKQIGYISTDFWIGSQINTHLLNLGIHEPIRRAVEELGLNLDSLLDQPVEPKVGQGCLGQLATSLLESLSTLEIPAIGYGIRYEFSVSKAIVQSGQVNIANYGRRDETPWELARPERSVEVKLGGYTEGYLDATGRYRVRWIPHYVIHGTPFDLPIPGYRTATVNTLRLWTIATATVNLTAALPTVDSPTATTVLDHLASILYPLDDIPHNQPLCLQQKFFLVSCALQDVVQMHRERGLSLLTLPERFVLQLDGTDLAIAVAELMRLLVDEHDIDWEAAWSITRAVLVFTHCKLSVEQELVLLFEQLLPRHLEIIYEINSRFLEQVRGADPNDADRVRRMSLIDEAEERSLNLTHLACIGSHAIGGATALQTEFLQQHLLPDFHQWTPELLHYQVGGLSPRQFMVINNPKLARFLTHTLGDRWITDLDMLRQLETLADTPEFRQEWRQIKQAAKQELATYLQSHYSITVDPSSLFDIQAASVQEYRRQLLNLFYIITLYNRIKANPAIEMTPRTCIVAGNVAPADKMATFILALINGVAQVVNHDPEVGDRLKLVVLQDDLAKLAQHLYSAADLTEQIALAGSDASGIGNLAFAMNGAITIGTLGGVNLEVCEEVGAENFFLFGLTVEEVNVLKVSGYEPWYYYRNNADLRGVVDRIASGYFSEGDADRFNPLIDPLLGQDDYLLLADYPFYLDCQDRINQVYSDQDHWTWMSILTVARIGKFSSDRTVRECSQTIWQVGGADAGTSNQGAIDNPDTRQPALP
jgi:starch phosphorylase